MCALNPLRYHSVDSGRYACSATSRIWCPSGTEASPCALAACPPATAWPRAAVAYTRWLTARPRIRSWSVTCVATRWLGAGRSLASPHGDIIARVEQPRHVELLRAHKLGAQEHLERLRGTHLSGEMWGDLVRYGGRWRAWKAFVALTPASGREPTAAFTRSSRSPT